MRNGSYDSALEKNILSQLTSISSINIKIKTRVKEIESLIQEYENTLVINADGLLVRKNLKILPSLLEQQLEIINILIEELEQVEYAKKKIA